MRIRLAIAAEPSRGFHALLKGREAAICPAIVKAAVIRTPRIVLGLGARCEMPVVLRQIADMKRSKSFMVSSRYCCALSYERLPIVFIPGSRAMRRDGRSLRTVRVDGEEI